MKVLISIVVFCVVPIFSNAQIDLTSGLLACYSFAGNALDKSGNDNDGQVFGAVLTKDRFGNDNSAYLFDGSNDFIRIPANDLINDNYSYSAWALVNTLPSPGASGHVISIGEQDPGRHQTLNVNNSFAGASYTGWNSGGYNIGAPTTTSCTVGSLPSALVWYHLVVTRSLSEMRLYIDGVLVKTSSTNSTLPYYGDAPFVANIGVRCNGSSPFDGVIDDIAIYDRVLNPDEVLSLYENGLPCGEVEVSNVSRCGPGSVTMKSKTNEVLFWYETEASTEIISESAVFDTPSLTESRSYFYADLSMKNVGAKKKVDVVICKLPTALVVPPDQCAVGVTCPFLLQEIVGVTDRYLWTFENQNIETSTPYISYAYKAPGMRSFSISFTDENGCEFLFSSSLTVTPSEVLDVSRCGIGPVTLKSTNGASLYWYEDEVSADPFFQGSVLDSPVLLESRSYYYSDVENDIRKKVDVTINPLPTADVVFPALCFQRESCPYFLQNIIGIANQYTWSFDGQIVQTSIPRVNFIFTNFGNNEVSVQFIDNHGCPFYFRANLPIQPVRVFIPNLLTPNSDAKNEIFTAFADLSTGYTRMTFNDFRMDVYNRWGEKIFSCADSFSGWDGEGYAAGVYFYSIKIGDESFKGSVTIIR